MPWIAYAIAVNLAAFAAFGQDKRNAQRNERRIPERTLLMMAAIGGSLGAVAAQRVFRHKTRKEPFRTILYLIVAAQGLALVALVATAYL
jgi:uncharacterized membrane protein YsdA (DUF1294 family)